MDAEKRESILDSAVRAFGRHGFKKASIEDIAQHAGVAKGTVYLACESKEELYYLAVLREVREFLAQCAHIIDPRVSADVLLERCARASVKLLDSHPLARDLLAARLIDLPEWRERFRQLRALCNGAVAEVLRLGVNQGLFRPDLDIEETANLLGDLQAAAYAFHSVQRELDGEEPPFLDRMLAGLRLMLDGLRAR
jgi:AcrR family transcriptional regulator